jgi:hypothetical protein
MLHISIKLPNKKNDNLSNKENIDKTKIIDEKCNNYGFHNNTPISGSPPNLFISSLLERYETYHNKKKV